MCVSQVLGFILNDPASEVSRRPHTISLHIDLCPTPPSQWWLILV